ncbi:MAG: DnaJ family domain-containing protein [Armatimonadota bacterium]
MPEYDISRAFEIIAERKITEAMEEGKFDNLPGKGEPLQIDPQWLVPPHLRLAATILHNAEVLPEWAQTDREIVMAREAIGILRRRVQAEYPLRCEKPQFPEWYANILQTLLRLMRRVNDLILQYNISSPVNLHVHAPFAVEREIQMLLAEFPPPESLNIPRVLSEASGSSGAVRVEAQARYERIQTEHKEAPPDAGQS